MATPDPNVLPPVVSRFRAAMLMAPLLGMAVAAVVCGNRAAGLFAAGVTLILWAAILKFFGPRMQPPAPPPPPTSRPVFVGPAPLPPVSHRAEKITRVASDSRAPEGERAAARAALRRLHAR